MASTGQRWCTGIDLAFGQEEKKKKDELSLAGKGGRESGAGVPFLAVISLQ